MTISKVKQWTHYLGIDDKEFLKHTDGTIKFSIKFTDFNGKDEVPFHYPFGAPAVEGTKLNYKIIFGRIRKGEGKIED